MQNKDLRRMSRKDLLEILVEQQKIIEKLELKISEYEEKEESERIVIDNAGSIAEAVVSLSDIFDRAQSVADQYLCEIENLKKRSVQQAQEECDRMIEDAQEKASMIIRDAEATRIKKLQELNAYVKEINQKVDLYFKSHPEVKGYVENNSSSK